MKFLGDLLVGMAEEQLLNDFSLPRRKRQILFQLQPLTPGKNLGFRCQFHLPSLHGRFAHTVPITLPVTHDTLYMRLYNAARTPQLWKVRNFR
jgi:hypothetical protein